MSCQLLQAKALETGKRFSFLKEEKTWSTIFHF